MNVRSDADQLVYSSSSFERKAVGVRFIRTGDELPVFFTDSACPSVFSTVTVTWLLKAERAGSSIAYCQGKFYVYSRKWEFHLRSFGSVLVVLHILRPLMGQMRHKSLKIMSCLGQFVTCFYILNIGRHGLGFTSVSPFVQSVSRCIQITSKEYISICRYMFVEWPVLQRYQSKI